MVRQSVRRRRSPEADMQAQIVAYCDGLGIFLSASKNGAFTSSRVGAIYKRLGVREGFPDLMVLKVGGRGEPARLEYSQFHERVGHYIR